MSGVYVAGAVGVAVAAQDGMAQLAQSMAADPGLSEIAKQAEQVTGLGISTTDAGVLITVLVVCIRLIDANRGLFVTLNDWVRRVLGLHPMQPPPPPAPKV